LNADSVYLSLAIDRLMDRLEEGRNSIPVLHLLRQAFSRHRPRLVDASLCLGYAISAEGKHKEGALRRGRGGSNESNGRLLLNFEQCCNAAPVQQLQLVGQKIRQVAGSVRIHQ
jgi:IS5 family transposase